MQPSRFYCNPEQSSLPPAGCVRRYCSLHHIRVAQYVGGSNCLEETQLGPPSLDIFTRGVYALTVVDQAVQETTLPYPSVACVRALWASLSPYVFGDINRQLLSFISVIQRVLCALHSLNIETEARSPLGLVCVLCPLGIPSPNIF